MTYRVNDIYPCLQGEGVWTGQAMVLVRLQGCGVGCPWCDTKETWAVDPGRRGGALLDVLGTGPAWAEASPEAIAAECRRQGPAIGWALVTGGEPAEQELAGLVSALHAEGFRVAIETSGTATGHVGAGFDWVCVSPKFGMHGGRPVITGAVWAADEVKMVIGKKADIDRLDLFLAATSFKAGARVQVCLQPVSASQEATALCVATVLDRGWRLSLQTHKYLEMR